LRDFQQALEIDPNHINAAYSKASAENQLGNYAQAIKDYHFALQLDSSAEDLATP
jgi:tetratricopeptide (TPR) repeat protein